MATRKVIVGEEVQNMLTGERFTYMGVEKRPGDDVIVLESEGQKHRVDFATFREFFRTF